jgi:isoleucyl-tRNA synthetase
MNDTTSAKKPGKDAATTDGGRDWSQTLYLPKTEFPMRAGLPEREPILLERWRKMGLYERLREQAKGRARFTLHDGPPYANGNIHIGHALNKILKDLVTRSQQMLGFDSNYVPGWDCHGLPIEWKIEEDYIAKGKPKPNLKDPVALKAFRAECRSFAEHWMAVQSAEFQRLGVEGDWKHPYTTMTFPAEAQIARELMKFAETGQLYRGSKPVMWSVVEKTALAEAEIEYHDYQSDMVWVKFPVLNQATVPDRDQTPQASDISVVIWTTTPWTIPGNRAISFNNKIAYGVYEVTKAPADNWAKVGDKYILADKLAADVMKTAKIEAYEKRGAVTAADLSVMLCAHPLRGAGFQGYQFNVPLLDGDHVTDDTGTGFVHTAPGHGREDFDIWTASTRLLQSKGIDPAIPYTVDENGAYTKDAPGFTGERVITDTGSKGGANDAVIKALSGAGTIIARGRLKHQYPHSWRSKKPVIFRNTPQWFIHMDKAIPFIEKVAARGTVSDPPGLTPDVESLRGVRPGGLDTGIGHNQPSPKTLREASLQSIRETEWVPASGENRIRGMIEAKPDWVVSRQRAWGVPITVFVRKGTNEVLVDARVNTRIYHALYAEGADAWFADADGARFLKPDHDPAQFEKINDVLDVWFDSGSTHTYVLEDAVHFPGLAGFKRIVDGGKDRVMYLEGSDQHRGWFHSSLIESSGTRGRAPYDVVLTHGFTMDEKGQKMSKSLGNGVEPQDVIKQSGADILRLWVAGSDYSDDQRIGKEILKTFSESYRKMRNTLRWMLGTLAHYDPKLAVEAKDMPELERLMLHRLSELDVEIRKAYETYEYRKVVSVLAQFMNTELSAFYFDIRKDALYCEAPSSLKRRAALTCVEHIFRCVTVWLAPILAFTAEECWLSRYGDDGKRSVHLELFPDVPVEWRDHALAEKWDTIRRIRSVVTGALEEQRAAKTIGSSLEASPIVYIKDAKLLSSLDSVDFAEICITSSIAIVNSTPPANEAFVEIARQTSVGQIIGVIIKKAAGTKCARSWRYTTDVGSDSRYPDLSARDAKAVAEIDGLKAS